MAGVSNGAVKKCRVSDGIKPNHWSAAVSNSCNNLVLVQLLTPASSVIGRAQLTIDTVRRAIESTSASSIGSLTVQDEYDVITGGFDLKEQQVGKAYKSSYSGQWRRHYGLGTHGYPQYGSLIHRKHTAKVSVSIFKCWSFLRSKSINNVCKLFHLLGDSSSDHLSGLRPSTPLANFRPPEPLDYSPPNHTPKL